MILVSFSSAGDALSNDVKKYDILARKVLKIPRRSAFSGTPGIKCYGKHMSCEEQKKKKI